MTTDTQLKTEIVEAKRVNYDPVKPVGTASGLKDLLNTMKGSIAQALPKHVTPERLIKTLLVAANRNPDLLKCTQASVLETINRAAELGLDLSGTLGEAYPVPFNNNIGNRDKPVWVKQCTLIIGYRGLEKLAWQSGEVQMIDAEVVCEHDRFVFKKGFDPQLEWEPKMDGDRGKPIGAYALIITKAGGRMARFMPVGDIEKIRQAAVSKDSPAWRNHWSEMARKTALRRVLKDAPLSTEKLTAAMEQDDADFKMADVLEAETMGIASLPSGRSSFAAPKTEAAETEEPPPQETTVPDDDKKAKRQKLQAAERTRAEKGCDPSLPGCCEDIGDYTVGEDGRKTCANHFDTKSESKPEADKPTRSKEDIKADLDRSKHGCRPGTPGCDSASIKKGADGKGHCANHPEA